MVYGLEADKAAFTLLALSVSKGFSVKYGLLSIYASLWLLIPSLGPIAGIQIVSSGLLSQMVYVLLCDILSP